MIEPMRNFTVWEKICSTKYFHNARVTVGALGIKFLSSVRYLQCVYMLGSDYIEVWSKRKDDKECCEVVFSHWLDHPPHHYPATWEGLYELLNDSELGQVATELKQAVDNAL